MTKIWRKYIAKSLSVKLLFPFFGTHPRLLDSRIDDPKNGSEEGILGISRSCLLVDDYTERVWINFVIEGELRQLDDPIRQERSGLCVH